MDTVRTKVTPELWRKYWYIAVLLLLLLGTYFFKSFMGSASFIVNKQELITAVVQLGNFKINVRATGVLKPVNIRWVSSQVSGRVEQAFVKAGANVTKGQILMQLSNPELHRELEKTRWEFEAKKAENYAAYVALESQLVDLKNSVVQADYSTKPKGSGIGLSLCRQIMFNHGGTIKLKNRENAQGAQAILSLPLYLQNQ
jgi:HlyD family secretion protein